MVLDYWAKRRANHKLENNLNNVASGAVVTFGAMAAAAFPPGLLPFLTIGLVSNMIGDTSFYIKPYMNPCYG
jgi:hypothetical protein